MVQRKTNPRTKITTIQKDWEADFYHRLIDGTDDRPGLASRIRERVVDEDMLEIATLELAAVLQDGFEFTEDPDATADFEDWLDEEVEWGVLERTERERIANGEHYTGDYVRRSSERGILHGDRELRRGGIDPEELQAAQALVQHDVHERVVRAAYLRTYDELDGITSEMSREIRRTLSQGLADGWGPRKMATAMNDRVRKVGLTRSRMLARTESARAYNDHAMVRYDEHGVEEVGIGTREPCEVCADLADKGPYPLDEAPRLPRDTHPNCICYLFPVVE